MFSPAYTSITNRFKIAVILALFETLDGCQNTKREGDLKNPNIFND